MDFDCSKAPAGVSCEFEDLSESIVHSPYNHIGTPNAGLAKFEFTTGKTHRLRLINGGSEGTQRFTIDNHTMTVIANDFVPVKPYETNVVTLGVCLAMR